VWTGSCGFETVEMILRWVRKALCKFEAVEVVSSSLGSPEIAEISQGCDRSD
jgi:hypothetical protein